MGVRVISAMTPLDADTRAKMRLLGALPSAKISPTPYDAGLTHDTAPFDSPPGAGFDSEPAAAAIVPPAGRVTGSGAVLVVDPAQNNSFRALNRAWAGGATVQRLGDRYAITGLSADAQDDLVRSLALVAERRAGTPRGPADAIVRKPRIGLYQPWTGSMDEGWTRWLLEQYGFPFTSIHPEDFRHPLRDRGRLVRPFRRGDRASLLTRITSEIDFGSIASWMLARRTRQRRKRHNVDAAFGFRNRERNSE